jgi:hypothetical protein
MHTIASSLVRLPGDQSGSSQSQIIFLMAMTHAVIHVCLPKLRTQIRCYTPN